MAQPKIEILLPELLKDFTIGFEKNELAFLSIQGKNEQQIRDKIAWRLHNALAAAKEGYEHVVVRREWSPDRRSRSKVDLAVLLLDDKNEKVSKTLALIEFKAQSLARPENWYLDEFAHDVFKMYNMCEDDQTQMYFVFLHSAQSSYEAAPDVVQAAKLYRNSKTALCSIDDDSQCKAMMKTEWEKFFKETISQKFNKHTYEFTYRDAVKEIPKPKIQYIGTVYNTQCFTAAMIWGPYVKGDIKDVSVAPELKENKSV